MLSELKYGSFLTYDPRSKAVAENEAKQWMYRIKADSTLLLKSGGQMSTARYCAAILAKDIAQTPLGSILTPEAVLVPVPGAGLQKSSSLWVAERLAKALVHFALGSGVATHIVRTIAVPKSAFAKPGERPSALDHYKSFAPIQSNMLHRGKFVLIDDVVTKGATMIAAASRLSDAFPHAEVCGFAMLRTMGYRSSFVQWKDAVVGSITTDKWGNSSRDP